jgi:hypothetical protein
MAKGFYNLAIREGPIEDFHAEKRVIGQKGMEAINRHAFNRIGYMFNLLHNGENEKFEKLCILGALPLDYFDPLDFNSKEVKGLETILREAELLVDTYKKYRNIVKKKNI